MAAALEGAFGEREGRRLLRRYVTPDTRSGLYREATAPEDVPADLEARMDRSHLRQVLWNLCDNAVKYASETGGILVEIHADRVQGQGRPYVEVRDHGLGVDASTAEKMFEPFYTERSGGTGLGLYISRELCELNRATLLYLDRPGGGSIFRIVFADPDRWESAQK